MKLNLKMPKVTRGNKPSTESDFPIDDASASSIIEFSSNPIMFKIKKINRDVFDTTTGVSAIIGSAFHKAVEVYYGGNEEYPIRKEEEGEGTYYTLISGTYPMRT